MPTLFRRDRERQAADPIALHRGGAMYPACKSPTSACRGGRQPCPSPEACRQAEIVPAARFAIEAAQMLGALFRVALWVLAAVGLWSLAARIAT